MNEAYIGSCPMHASFPGRFLLVLFGMKVLGFLAPLGALVALCVGVIRRAQT